MKTVLKARVVYKEKTVYDAGEFDDRTLLFVLLEFFIGKLGGIR